MASKVGKLFNSETPRHGFTTVDEEGDPGAWIAVLDKLRTEPFYNSYKQRVLNLLEVHDGGRYLDLGSGTGDDARTIADAASCSVVAADRSQTMATVCLTRGRVPPVVCEAADLPFPDETFDGALADRTFQHFLEPALALAETVRVIKPGARLVVVDPDYDTQVMEFPDQALARKVLRYRADAMLRNGTIAHQMAGKFSEAGLRSIAVEPLTLTVRDPSAVDNVMGLKTWASTAASHGYIAKEDAERWEHLFDETVQSGRFLYAVTFFITVGIK